jgi:hypothetical protein
LRRERDDEPGNARNDGTGQRHGRCGNAGRIASIAIGLLRVNPAVDRRQQDANPFPGGTDILPPHRMGARDGPDQQPIMKPYLMVRLIFPAYVFFERPHRACPRRRCSDGRRADGARHVLCPRVRQAALSGSFMRVKSIICRQLTLWHWSRASVRFQGGKARAL